MHPILFSIAGHPVASYGVALAVAFALGIAVARRRAVARGLDGERVVDVSLWIALAAFAGARLLWVATHLESVARSWLDALVPLRGGSGTGLGLSMHGGVALALLVAAVFFVRQRLPFLPYADVIAPSLLLGEGIARIGCFLNGCCYGLASGLPWSVHFPPDAPATRLLGDVSVHPTQLYASLLCFAGFGGVLALARRRPADGIVFAACLLVLAVGRVALDFLRVHDPATVLWRSGAWLLTVHQVFCLGLIALAACVLARARRRPAPRGLLGASPQ